MKFKRTGAKKGRVEIIPMIDSILMLLIFYMTFGRFAQQESQLKVEFPVAIQQAMAQKQDDIEVPISVKGKDVIFVNEKQYTVQTLNQMLFRVKSSFKSVLVEIQGTKESTYQDVIDVLNTCAALKLNRVVFTPL